MASYSALKTAYHKGRFDAGHCKRPHNQYRSHDKRGGLSKENAEWKMYNRGYYSSGGRIACSWDKEEFEQLEINLTKEESK